MSPEPAPSPYPLAPGEVLSDVLLKTGRVTVKAGPDETGNAFSQFEVDDPRGSGPPLHIHHNEARRSTSSRARAPCSSATSGSTSRQATTASARAASPTPTSSAPSVHGCS